MPAAPKPITRNFASDNNAGVHPEIIEAIARANQGHVVAYGDDPYTRSAVAKFEEHFGPGPFAAGAALSALDLYLVAMTRWRPGHAWFAANTPRLLAAAEEAASHLKLAPVVARHRVTAAEGT